MTYSTVEAFVENDKILYCNKAFFPKQKTKVLITFIEPEKLLTENGFSQEFENDIASYLNSDEYKNEDKFVCGNDEDLLVHLNSLKKK